MFCERCGEKFQAGQEVAEIIAVEATYDYYSGSRYNGRGDGQAVSLTVHQQCMLPGEEIA